MNLENFHEFLKEPSNLHRVSYQELKSLVAAYPYSTNLRILLLLKSKLDKHPELSRNLSLAATYTSDRSLLHKIIHNPVLAILAQEVVEEEVLELMDLEKVEAIMSKEQPLETSAKEMQLPPIKDTNSNWTSDIFENAAPVAAAGATVISMDSFLNTIAQENEVETLFGNDEQEEVRLSQQMIMNFTVDNFVGFSNMLESFEYNRSKPIEIVNDPTIEKRYSYERNLKPLPKDSFASWLSQFEKDLNREMDVPDINKNIEEVENHKVVSIVKEKPKPVSIKKVAERSLHLNNAIVSETLASLLVKQERFNKAIDMYQKLSLKYPEKSHIFAAEIEKLKNL